MANDSSVVSVTFTETTQSVTSRAVYQYDHGLTLQVYGLSNLTIDQIHFSNSDTGKAINNLSNTESDGAISASIPDVLLAQDKDIYAFLYFEDDTTGYTARTIRIPMIPRAKPESLSLSSPSMGIVNQLAQELEAQIDEVETLKKETTDATDAANQAASNANTSASAADKSASAASQSAEEAEKATENAEQAAEEANSAASKLNSISFEVNPEDGCLYMYTE